MKSKLEKILQILTDNSEIEVMVNQKPNDSGGRGQTINVCVAPKIPILDNADLGQLLGAIQSSIESKSGFKPSSGGYPSSWTFVCFEEILGQTSIREENNLRVKDEFSLGRFGGVNENTERKELIKREIFIRLFLRIELAKINHQKYAQNNDVFETRASLLSRHHD